MINLVSIKLKNPTYNLASIKNQDAKINKTERYFPVTIKAENGNLIDVTEYPVFFYWRLPLVCYIVENYVMFDAKNGWWIMRYMDD